MYDLLQNNPAGGSGNPTGGILKNVAAFVKEDTPGNTPSASIQVDNQSEVGDDNNIDLTGDKFTSTYKKMREPMDLDEMICRSVCTNDNPDLRKRLANQIILIGGVTKTRKLTDSLEEAVMDRFTSGFDNTIERVNVELYNVQQYQQFQQHQIILQSTGQ
jgi:Actin